MTIDKFGTEHKTANQLCDALYKDPSIDIWSVAIDDPEQFNQSIKALFYDSPKLQKYIEPTGSVEEFDAANQATWFMPEEYKSFDIAKFILDQCQSESELQRAGEELLMYQERNLFDLLRFMKYFVDHLRSKHVFWGVGRGSSVASFVLYLIGVHRINSMYYDLDIKEFLK